MTSCSGRLRISKLALCADITKNMGVMKAANEERDRVLTISHTDAKKIPVEMLRFKTVKIKFCSWSHYICRGYRLRPSSQLAILGCSHPGSWPKHSSQNPDPRKQFQAHTTCPLLWPWMKFRDPAVKQISPKSARASGHTLATLLRLGVKNSAARLLNVQLPAIL